MKSLALHRGMPLRPLPRLGLTAAALILGAALAGAIVLYGHRASPYSHRALARYCQFSLPSPQCFERRRPGWVAPAALGTILLGVAGAAGALGEIGETPE